MIYDEIVSWASTFRGTPKQSSKTYSAGRKTPRCSQYRGTNYDLRQNCLLGMNVSRHTETVTKNVLSGSKNPQVQSKLSNRLWFGTKSAPWHQRFEAHRNSPQKRTQWVEKPPRTVKTETTDYDLGRTRLLCISVSRFNAAVPKNILSGSKNSQVQSKASNSLLFAIKSSPGHQRSRYTEIVLKNRLSWSKNPQVLSFVKKLSIL